MGETTVMWIAAAVLLAAGAAIALFGGVTTQRQQARTTLLTLATLVGSVGYVVMASGGGRIGPPIAPEGFLIARYADWLITTPLLLSALAITAFPVGRAVPEIAAGLIILSVLMVATGALAEAVATGSAFVWFVLSSAIFAAILLIVWAPLQAAAAGGHPDREAVFHRHAGMLTAAWALYPVVFLLGPAIFGATDAFGVTIMFACLDVVSKGVYGVLVALDDHHLLKAEKAERAAVATERVRAAFQGRDDGDLPADAETVSDSTYERARRRLAEKGVTLPPGPRPGASAEAVAAVSRRLAASGRTARKRAGVLVADVRAKRPQAEAVLASVRRRRPQPAALGGGPVGTAKNPLASGSGPAQSGDRGDGVGARGVRGPDPAAFGPVDAAGDTGPVGAERWPPADATASAPSPSDDDRPRTPDATAHGALPAEPAEPGVPPARRKPKSFAGLTLDDAAPIAIAASVTFLLLRGR